MKLNGVVLRNIVGALILFLLAFGASAQSSVATAQAVEVGVQIFPNPTSDFIFVRLGHLRADESQVSLHNIIGNQIPTRPEKVEENLLKIPVKGISPGYYFVTVRNERTRYKGVFKTLVQE